MLIILLPQKVRLGNAYKLVIFAIIFYVELAGAIERILRTLKKFSA